MSRSLKSKNILWLGTFLLINSLIFWSLFFAGTLDFRIVCQLWGEFAAKNGLIAALAPLATLILNGLVGSSVKETLIFWRIGKRLPGCWAFTKLAYKDPRIDVKSLEKVIGTLPENPLEQNRLWFRLYKSCESKPAVSDSHSSYLLTRDMAAFSSLFLLIMPALTLLKPVDLKVTFVYLVCLIVQYLVINVAARSYAKRFVCNVLAEVSSGS